MKKLYIHSIALGAMMFGLIIGGASAHAQVAISPAPTFDLSMAFKMTPQEQLVTQPEILNTEEMAKTQGQRSFYEIYLSRRAFNALNAASRFNQEWARSYRSGRRWQNHVGSLHRSLLSYSQYLNTTGFQNLKSYVINHGNNLQALSNWYNFRLNSLANTFRTDHLIGQERNLFVTYYSVYRSFV